MKHEAFNVTQKFNYCHSVEMEDSIFLKKLQQSNDVFSPSRFHNEVAVLGTAARPELL